MSGQPRVGIVTDSTADIPSHLLGSLKIAMVPALLIVDGQTYVDGVDLTREEFYRRLPSFNSPPTTASPSPIKFKEAYERLLTSGIENVLSIHISSKLSGIINAAHQAAQEFGDRVKIFDSQQLSLGLGYQAIEAAVAALNGMSIEDVFERTLEIKKNVRLLALINSLEYLRRSGRVNWLQASMSELLQIKMLLTIKDGLVESFGRARTFGHALDALRREARSWAPMSQLTVMHSGIFERAYELAEELSALSSSPPMKVNVTTVIGAHVGPGSLGIAGLPRL